MEKSVIFACAKVEIDIIKRYPDLGNDVMKYVLSHPQKYYTQTN